MDNERLRVCIESYREGDKNAFAEMYNDLKTPVFTIVYRMTRSREMSEDILQDLFVKLYRSPPDVAVVKNPRAYIFQMARNLTLNSMRGVQSVELNEELGDGASFADAVVWQVDIAEAMSRLPGDEVEIVSLRVNGELKFREIAELLGTPLGTVLWKYRKAVQTLRSYLNGG